MFNGEQKSWRKDLFRLSIMTLITVVVWIGFTTYQALTKSQIKPDVKKAILPLMPTLDIDTMEKIKQKQATPPIDWSSLKSAKPEILTVPKEATASSHENQ